MRVASFLPVILMALSVGEAAATTPAVMCCQEISYTSTSGKPVHGQVAIVDLRTASVKVTALQTEPECLKDRPLPLVSPEVVQAYSSTELTINANFFEIDKSQNPHTTACAKSIGLAMNGGQVISPSGTKVWGALPDSLLFFPPKTVPAVEVVRQPGQGYKPPPNTKEAVSGLLIVFNAKDISNEQHIPAEIKGLHPRTAIGLSKDLSTAYVVVIEGRLPASEGISLPDLASYMVKTYETYHVLNLDGGGSSSLVAIGPSIIGQTLTLPSDKFPLGSKFQQYRPAPINISFRGAVDPCPKERLVLGTPVPVGQTVQMEGTKIHLSGRFDLLQRSELSLRAGTSIDFMPNTWLVLHGKNRFSGMVGKSPGCP